MQKKAAHNYSALTIGLHTLYWPVYCLIVSFAVMFLLSRDFSNTQIGLITAFGNIAAVLFQQPLAALIDRSERFESNHGVFYLCSIILPLLLLVLFGNLSLATVAILFTLVFAGISMVQSLLNAMAMELNGRGHPVNYGLARGIGCLIGAVALWLGGLWAEEDPDVVMRISAAGLLFIMMGSRAFRMPPRTEPKPKKQKQKGAMAVFSRRYPSFFLFVGGALLALFSYFVAGNYLIHVLTPLGGGNGELGIAYAISAAVEFMTLSVFSTLAKRFPVEKLLKFAVACLPLKTITLCLAPSVFVVYIAQMIHAFGAALFFPASIYFINSVVQSEHRAQGQAFLVAASLCSAVLASALGGWSIDLIGMRMTLWLASAVTILGGFILFGVTAKLTAGEEKHEIKAIAS